jgi:nucleoporin NUP1
VDVATSTSASRPDFSFAKLSQAEETNEAPPKAPEPPKLPFSFGTSSDQKRPEIETIAPKPLFAASNATSTLFGDSASHFAEPPRASPFGTTGPPQSTPSPLPFSFGSNTSQNTTATAAPVQPSQSTLFGAASTPATAADAPKSVFGNSGPFSFAPEPVTKAKEVKTTPAPFSFGAAPSTPPTAPVAVSKPAPAPVFSFDQSSTNTSSSIAAPISFSFSGGGSTSADVSNKQLFMFGQTNPIAPTARPVTPPKNSDNEFRMEESPTREMQQNGNGKPAESRSTLGGFSFGTNNSDSNAGSSLFGGGQNSATGAPLSTPFSFGSSSLANPFAPKNPQPEEPKGFSGFGQTTPIAPTISTTFSFGQQLKSPEDAQRPSTTAPFSFAATPTSATSATPAFSFSGAANSIPFGQPPSGSAPSSPSTFNQPSSFAFGAPAASAGGGFAFGSQPASPAGGANLTLPQSSFGTGGGFGQSAPQQPSSPFNSPLALAPSTSSGGSLFTMGSAPAANGPRQIKKLPNRRGGAKR